MISPRQSDHLIVHEIDDEVLLYDPEVDRSHGLNPTATVIWRHCDGRHSEVQIARVLEARFAVGFDQALADTSAVVQQMALEKIVQPANG